MPQRNGQNPTRAAHIFGHGEGLHSGDVHGTRHGGSCEAMCPACKVDIQPRPGFRFSALRCPKCGGQAVKK